MRLCQLPFYGVAISISTIVICLVSARFVHEYDHYFIYISESGSQYPQLPLFGFGLSLSAFIIYICLRIWSSVYSKSSHKTGQINRIINILGTIGSVCLSLLSVVSLYQAPVLHTVFAHAFFHSLMIVSFIVTTVSIKTFKHHNPSAFCVPRWLKFRLAVLFIMVPSILIFVLVPLILGDSPFIHNLAALLQYVSVLMLLLFFISLKFELQHVSLVVVYRRLSLSLCLGSVNESLVSDNAWSLV
ncbi:hypothetical protein P9112_002760 [Eukaryota sp. TZLM1-RC]